MNILTVGLGILMLTYFLRKLLNQEGNLKFILDMMLYLVTLSSLTFNSFLLANIIKAKLELGIT